MSTKYGSVGLSQILDDQTEMTNHARRQYEKRTPRDAVGYHEAWERGEYIKHEDVARSPDGREIEDVRVYHDPDGWVIAFIVGRDRWGSARRPRVVVSCLAAETYQHKPTRAYVRAHGPHDGGDANE